MRSASGLEKAGFSLVATRGTAEYLTKRGVAVEMVNKVFEGRPHIVDSIKDRQVDLVINTVYGAEVPEDSYSIRRTTLTQGIPYFTTMSAAKARVRGIEALRAKQIQVRSIQEYQQPMTKKVPMTREGYEKIKKELDQPDESGAPQEHQGHRGGPGHGDLSENADTTLRRSARATSTPRSAKLEHKLAHAQIIDVSKLTNEKVRVRA